MWCAFFWVIPRRRNFLCQPFATNGLFPLHRQEGTHKEEIFLHAYPPVKMEQTVCFERLAYKIQTPGNYPEESIQEMPLYSILQKNKIQ
jgi:hypothetical protein